MSQKSDRVEAAVRAWKAKLQREQTPRARRSGPVNANTIDELERAAQRLDRELAEVASNRTIVARRLDEFEKRAMEAIREGHDVTARRMLMAPQECAETLEQLEADVKVLRAMLAECEEGLAEAKARSS